MKKAFSEKQIQILSVAEELIAKKGFDGTSVREISTAAGVNVAMISYYFGSKEKMMESLFRFRIQKNKEHFSELTQTIKEGKPEMQMKEIIKFFTSQYFKYSYFYAFISLEIRENKDLKTDLIEFYKICVSRIDDVIKKGVTTGVFTFAPKPEDVLTNILGSTLFTIRNKNFVELYVHTSDENNYFIEAEKKLRAHITFTIFAILGFAID